MVFVRVNVIKGRLRADTPEQAEEALAIVYGPGRHTGTELSSYAQDLPAQGRG